ncbi:uncharacterized protein IAS62_003828 [Cryptococcus decagattii]|uniref:F-box domain-containing protein n=1 Tax=Cryptococcus decagattii TaxID=1859122 RepID=A0ABZ2AVD4_9TREE
MAHIAARTPPYTPPPFPLSQCHRSTHYHLRSPEDSGESEPEDKEDTEYLNKDIMESMEIDEDAYVHPQYQSAFLSLCPELIQRILSSFGGRNVVCLASLAATCHKLRAHIYKYPNQAIWRDIYLEIYDDPRKASAFIKSRTTAEIDWRKRLQDREFIIRALGEWHVNRWDLAAQHLDRICGALLDMYMDLPATSTGLISCSETDDVRHFYSSKPALNPSVLSYLLSSPCFSHLYNHYRILPSSPPPAQRLRPRPNSSSNTNVNASANPTLPLHSVGGHIQVCTHPKLAKLHTLLPPKYDENNEEDREWRGFMRELVYSQKNFTESNDWGPFTSDGKVDWVLVDALGSVMMSNAQEIVHNPEISDHWHDSIMPQSFGVEPTRGWGFSHIERPLGIADGDVWDWAGVQGSWYGSYAFLDYADWLSLNEPRLILNRGRVAQLDLTHYHEAIGDLMRLDLTLDDPSPTSPSTTLSPLTTHLPTTYDSRLPPIHFVGASLQSDSVPPDAAPLSSVRGVVQLTADDPPEVRWTLVIRYAGEDRWRLEGVQVGGRGSKRGFFGTWTDASKEEHSPNGPVWYWQS